MTILHIADIDIESSAGGMNTVIKRLLYEQSKIVNCILLIPLEGDEKTKHIEIPFKVYYNNNKKILKNILFNNKIDIVVFHSVFNLNFISFQKYILKEEIPYIVTTHGSLMRNVYNKGFIKKRLYKTFFLNQFIKEACGITFNLEDEHNNSFYQDKAYQIIPNLIDKNNIFSVKRTSKKIKLISVSKIDLYYKKIDLFIETLNEIKTYLKDIPFSYDIYGYGDERDINRLKKLIGNSDFSNNISYKGPIYGEEKLKQIKESDIFIQISSSESMSLGITEALSCGVPCFVSDKTNLQSVFDKYKSGWVTKIDKKSIAKKFIFALDEYMNNPEKYRLNARLLAEYYFSMNEHFGEISIGAYNKLLKGCKND